MGSNSNCPPLAQLRYVLTWFEEWSEMQRGDFLPILAQKFAPAGYVNGVVAGLETASCRDRPPSLFQCRVKLFIDWFDGWDENLRGQLLLRIREVDGEFMNRFEEEINGIKAPGDNSGLQIIENEEVCTVSAVGNA